MERNLQEALHHKWRDLLATWRADPVLADRAFEDVCQQYSGSGRFYHTLEHVGNVLETVDSLGSHARNRNAVKLAAWLHDWVYDSKASDNEERSALAAERLCQELAISEGPSVGSLIRKTKTHDAGDDTDAKVLLDADLAILGADDATYRNYAGQIRQEFAWVPDLAYRSGRRGVLERFLTRPRIYHFLDHLEEPARRNLAAEIARLAS